MGALRLMGAMGAMTLDGRGKASHLSHLPYPPYSPSGIIFNTRAHGRGEQLVETAVRVLFLIPVHMGEVSSWWGQQRGYYF